MNGIGEKLKTTRTSSLVSIEEASKDLNIKDVVLENIEAGTIGSFKNIYELRDNIRTYAKYLGLNEDEIINDFNEYIFEYTSKIPLKDIEKEVEKQIKEQEQTIPSPYTKPSKKHSDKFYIMVNIIIGLTMFLILTWAIITISIIGG